MAAVSIHELSQRLQMVRFGVGSKFARVEWKGELLAEEGSTT